jgi:hypothetical protein
MELAWLEDFIALVEAGNFLRAAERRYITQPAFSRRIRALEAWVGAPLFDRTPTVHLTPGDLAPPLSWSRGGTESALESAETLHFAATHALSLTH